jgi:oxalate---CoA ligase
VTIRELLERGDGDRVAVSAEGRSPSSFAALRQQADTVSAVLRALGIGPGDAVAVSLPNGPELATAVVAVAASASVAPLNPAYRSSEVDFYLRDLDARAIVVDDRAEGAAVESARACGVPILRVRTIPEAPAGCFRLEAEGGVVRSKGSSHAPDTALLLHTSGTTARPKLVPLSQHSLCRSAENIVETLRLGPADACLNVMPLFHVHGIVAGALASLAAGGSIWCSTGFNAHAMLRWAEASRATWCTAVPTMYQALLARVREGAARPAHNLRFLRSSSAPMPPHVWERLEEVFEVPLLNAYGMTEASHQVTSNPLPPASRKVGSVGVASHLDIAVVDDDGRALPAGARGEIVLRGETMTAGYERPAEANAAAFRGGWFHTGDQGVLDADGYLTLTSRLKELINCGGEKVSPYEVEDVLLQHPAVAQAVCFAVPDRVLGEEVGAAVVVSPARQLVIAELRRFAADRLVKFKVPRRIVVLDELPKGSTGKLQRIGLAATLGVGGRPS